MSRRDCYHRQIVLKSKKPYIRTIGGSAGSAIPASCGPQEERSWLDQHFYFRTFAWVPRGLFLPPAIRMYGLHSFSVWCKLVAGPFLSGTAGQVESSGVAHLDCLLSPSESPLRWITPVARPKRAGRAMIAGTNTSHRQSPNPLPKHRARTLKI